MRHAIAALALAFGFGCGHDGELAHAAEVFCHARVNEWARMSDQYQARAALPVPTELAAREADVTYGILTADARRVWGSDASSSFALCLEIRAVDPASARDIEHAFAAAHDPFLQGSSSLVAQAKQLADMANVLRDLNRRPVRD